MTSPLLDAKNFGAPSVFKPEALLREARRQKNLPEIAVPSACVLDPDGDIVAHLVLTGRARPHPGWACYHSELLTFDLPGVAQPVGVIGRAVGASFAVLLAEQLFASGCTTLVSITSSGRIAEDLPSAPHFVLIECALRDEGTSHHYLPPSAFAAMPEPALIAAAATRLAVEAPEIAVLRGPTWTTDAPFRETAAAICAARAAGCLVVEMEAAALYAFATASRRRILCVAHVTNTMGQDEGDFEKGEADGAAEALRLLSVLLRSLTPG